MRTSLRGLLLVVLGLTTACATTPSESEIPACDPAAAICEADDEPFDSKADELNVRRDIDDVAVIIGSPTAADRLLADLAHLRMHPVGAQIWADFAAATRAAQPTADASDQRVVLRPLDDESPTPLECARTIFRTGWLARATPTEVTELPGGALEIVTPGQVTPPGAIRVYYAYQCALRYPDGSPCFEPWQLLAHELIHATHGLRGTVLAAWSDPSDPMYGGSNHEEAHTIGRGAYMAVPVSENAIRTVDGFPVRDSHGELCGPRP